ncbi:MAG TPA: N-acetylglucosamine-6-phosphate deacetylase, partial [Chloroflexota bacterium]
MARFSVRGSLLLDGELVRGALLVDGRRIVQVLREPVSEPLPRPVVEADIVSPGLIDLQVNGGFGVEVGEDPESIRHLAEVLPSTGVTGFLATAISSPPDFYPRLFAAFATARDAAGARPLGLHLEGPLLSPLRVGAHRKEVIESADASLIDQLLESEDVRLVTLAPERPGAMEWICKLRDRDVIVSLGHTNATASELIRGIDAGATMVTHLFNAMSPFTHRAPGAMGATLADNRVIAGLIVDGIHSDPLSARLAVRAKGTGGIALVTDMMSAAGLPPGEYGLGGKKVIVDEMSARLEDGTLAGAIITLDEAVRNTARWAGVTPAQALTMATEVPARLLGFRYTGRLAAGMDADLALFDQNLQVQATYVGGEQVYRSQQ